MAKKLRILVADDSRVVRKAFVKILSADYDVIDVDNGSEAWDLLNQDDEICAIYADLDMPQPDALALLKKLRSADNKDINALPFIVIASESDDEAHRLSVLDAGATGFISKPFDSVNLLASAKEHVRPNQNALSYAKDVTLDSLTHLANRAYFMKRGMQEMSLANRHNANLSIVLVGISNFNAIMETQERMLIKKMLCSVGQYVGRNVRFEDIVARVDKATYAVLMPQTTITGALDAAERTLKKLLTEYAAGEFVDLRLCFGIGMASAMGASNITFEVLLRHADHCLKQAMQQGESCIVPDRNSISDQVDVEPAKKSVRSLDEAWELLKAGEQQKLDGSEIVLLKKLLPLLKYFNQHLDIGMTESLTRLGQRYGLE